MILRAEPIDPSRYAPFGAVVRAGAGPARAANHGTAAAWDALAVLENLRGDRARATASLYRCRPLDGSRLAVRWLERHPRSTQLFVPMRPCRYLVVVASGGAEPDLGTLAAFVIEGAQAVTYAPGTWHHPMVALGEETDFVNVLFADGSAEDCDERSFEPPAAEVVLP